LSRNKDPNSHAQACDELIDLIDMVSPQK